MNEKEEIAIKKWHESLHEPIQLALVLTESDQNKLFNDYVAEFAQIAPAVEIKKEKKIQPIRHHFGSGPISSTTRYPRKRNWILFLKFFHKLPIRNLLKQTIWAMLKKSESLQN